MTFDTYVSSFVPDKYTILGTELEHLTLGHYLLMRKFGSAFTTDDKEVKVGYEDFVVALCICSMPYEQFTKILENRIPNPSVIHRLIYSKDDTARLWYAPWKVDINYFKKYISKRGKRFRKVIIKQKYTIFDLKREMEFFVKYLKDGTDTPNYWEGDTKNDRESGAHWSQTLFTTAISELNYTRSEVLNTPLKQLFNDFYKYAESQGSISLMSDKEEALINE